MARVRSYWTVAATRLSQERRAEFHVEKQGFEYILPEFAEWRNGRIRPTLLFPGYIFVKVMAGWAKLASTRGIARLFMCGDTPARIPEKEIAGLLGRRGEDGLVRLRSKFGHGDKVEVTDEDDESLGLVGFVDGEPAIGRVRVLLSLLGRQVPMEFDERVLAAA